MGCQLMSMIKAAIHGQPEEDQPKPPFTDAQWNYLLTTLNNAIHDPHPQMARTNLAHLHSWLVNVRSYPGTVDD